MFVGRLAQAWRLVALALLPFALLGCSFAGPGGVFAQEPMALAEPAAGMRIERPSGYEPGDSLGFRLRDTSIAEQVFRRDAGGEHGLVWTAQFTSRWPTTPDQLDRWSAQAIGHLTDGLGTPVRLDGWERLSATGLRFIAFDGAGLLAMAGARALLRRRRAPAPS